MYEILLYYKYTRITNPDDLCNAQRSLCKKLGLTGRIIIAPEGINGTVEGLAENTQKYIDAMISYPRFADMNFKRSVGTGNAFRKISIKSRSEIVSAHLGGDDVNPAETTGKYLSPEELHRWIHDNKEFYIIDMRNDYEHAVGFFKNSILPPLKNFRDLPKVLPTLSHLKNKTVVTVCTGGVRCEKASGFLLTHGFRNVYQLHNGIVSYMEKYPEEDFAGKLYVFDGRITMGFSSSDKEHEVVGTCAKCMVPSENYVNCSLPSCNKHFICCADCLDINGKPFCRRWCAFIKKMLSAYKYFRRQADSKIPLSK